jgi:hypothetical protein
MSLKLGPPNLEMPRLVFIGRPVIGCPNMRDEGETPLHLGSIDYYFVFKVQSIKS